ncbi:tRNA (adenosine(37)-N6)-threonylcarbamoyltransferase complex ATPase subunit type 1 TsaE [Chlorobium phaeovibrioides]|uniref:tRNA threonylcarbamoyladenosine biosynthesis protein TsaE n=1 Tax=Chlorobium phaeovibrioides TaxID=1094 RepID=A0A432ATR0_CHLPH|nr:tRNA (adenosine(37)-N6)-threonylcarbamoyltransferase complex ATPase subunit type 1 TsaE [Chlorobium phaeovibrioides]KAA6231830.1 tRNA (adenosine(37)-N6)-threonylcarbamoyltransferase complex ATPase subunit type 1 TsaE [Chlorobium phaeovibrioides]MWV54186.1 tRNA (adenosine(37)-N6)-threonylcarbamoyltransferase complex ATPase subunit type 1 TsaE [Chlorobium phaeovibrioides]RTY34611.1 tRNA (adenosine(37)-N6)-threonylcarbamoyltransferase complex ATPase subunit type 1 TsaE [Chlorobium phaeovibrioide
MNGAFKEVFHSASALETRAVGRKFAASLPGGAVVALSGDLGAGKTEFMRGVAEFFCCAEQLSSPTFPILNIYNGLLQGDEVSIHHFDLYRIERPSELDALGFGEYLSSAWCSFVEWAERFGEYGDRYTARVLIEYEGDESRVITIEREE